MAKPQIEKQIQDRSLRSSMSLDRPLENSFWPLSPALLPTIISVGMALGMATVPPRPRGGGGGRLPIEERR